MTEPDPWPAREDLPPALPTESEQARRTFVHGTGIAGFVCAILAVVLFFVPFLDLLLALGGALFSGRALYLAKDTRAPMPMGVALALAGLILAVLALVPGVLVSYDAAYRH